MHNERWCCCGRCGRCRLLGTASSSGSTALMVAAREPPQQCPVVIIIVVGSVIACCCEIRLLLLDEKAFAVDDKNATVNRMTKAGRSKIILLPAFSPWFLFLLLSIIIIIIAAAGFSAIGHCDCTVRVASFGVADALSCPVVGCDCHRASHVYCSASALLGLGGTRI